MKRVSEKESILFGVLGGVSKKLGLPRILVRGLYLVFACIALVPASLVYLLGYLLSEEEDD